MTVAEKVSALLEGLSRRDLANLKPEQRKRLAASLRRIADIADPPAMAMMPKTGVLYDLNSGHRSP
jgi:hypothetical protein